MSLSLHAYKRLKYKTQLYVIQLLDKDCKKANIVEMATPRLWELTLDTTSKSINLSVISNADCHYYYHFQLKQKIKKSGKRKVQGVPQSQTATLPRHQEEEETDKTKQAQIEQMYEKHQD